MAPKRPSNAARMRGSASALWIIAARPPGAAIRHMKRAHASNSSSGIWCETAFGRRTTPVVVIGRIGEYCREGLGLDAIPPQRFAGAHNVRLNHLDSGGEA